MTDRERVERLASKVQEQSERIERVENERDGAQERARTLERTVRERTEERDRARRDADGVAGLREDITTARTERDAARHDAKVLREQAAPAEPVAVDDRIAAAQDEARELRDRLTVATRDRGELQVKVNRAQEQIRAGREEVARAVARAEAAEEQSFEDAPDPDRDQNERALTAQRDAAVASAEASDEQVDLLTVRLRGVLNVVGTQVNPASDDLIGCVRDAMNRYAAQQQTPAGEPGDEPTPGVRARADALKDVAGRLKMHRNAVPAAVLHELDGLLAEQQHLQAELQDLRAFIDHGAGPPPANGAAPRTTASAEELRERLFGVLVRIVEEGDAATAPEAVRERQDVLDRLERLAAVDRLAAAAAARYDDEPDG